MHISVQLRVVIIEAFPVLNEEQNKRTKFLLAVTYMGHLDDIQTALKPLKNYD